MTATHGSEPGFGEPDEHTGVGDWLFLQELSAEHEVGEGPAREPPEAHAALTGGDAVGHGEVPGAALPPCVQVFRAEQVERPWVGVGAGATVQQECQRGKERNHGGAETSMRGHGGLW